MASRYEGYDDSADGWGAPVGGYDDEDDADGWQDGWGSSVWPAHFSGRCCECNKPFQVSDLIRRRRHRWMDAYAHAKCAEWSPK